MGKRYLIDSNVIIDYSASRLSKNSSDFIELLFNNDFLISVVVKIEVLGFSDLPDKLDALERFIDTATLLYLDDQVTKKTIELRRGTKKIKLGDAIIAATALVHGLILLTNNTSDFKNIDGLLVVNPYDIV